jgi:hypothetical protein
MHPEAAHGQTAHRYVRRSPGHANGSRLPERVADGDRGGAAQAGLPVPSWYQLLTIAGALAVVNSVLMGGTVGLAVQDWMRCSGAPGGRCWPP